MTYQFKIQLDGFKNPEVWRKVTVPADYSFLRFHKVVAIIFGNELDNSMFCFSPSKKKSKPQITTIDFSTANNRCAKNTLLSAIFKEEGQSYVYTPDTDEKWTHHIVLEKMISQESSYPECLGGEGAYPPVICLNAEDYEEMNHILSDKNHPQYKDIQEWLELNENETWEDKYKFDLSKTNEQLMRIDKLFRNYTIVEHNTFDEQYGLTPELWNLIDEIKEQNIDGKNKAEILWKIKRITEQYPDIPHFKNTLAGAYMRKGDKNRFFEISQEIFTEYPNYIMARCNLASTYTTDDKLDKATELLGENFDLSDLYPNRNGQFTEVEIYHYHVVVFNYLLKIENDKEAKKHLNFLEYHFPDEIDKNMKIQLGMLRMEKMRKNYMEFSSVEVIPEQVPPADAAPDFENHEIAILYEKNAFIDLDIVYRIMELPRESLIKDLEKILIDSIARMDYYEKEKTHPDAPLHALHILSALEAEEALNTLFTVLRQDADYYNFYHGDMLTEEFWRFIYMMGQNKLDQLKNFMQEPNRYTYARTAVSQAVTQIAYHQKERKDEVMKWYEEIIQYMLDNQDNDDIFESRVYSFCIEDFIDVAGREQLSTILRLYDENLIEEETRTLPEIKKNLAKNTPDFRIHDIYTSIYQYYEQWRRWFCGGNDDNDDYDYEEEDYEDDYEVKKEYRNYSYENNEKEWENKPSTPFIAAPKVGRNEPCPCGSGKKYKKCCGGK